MASRLEASVHFFLVWPTVISQSCSLTHVYVLCPICPSSKPLQTWDWPQGVICCSTTFVMSRARQVGAQGSYSASRSFKNVWSGMQPWPKLHADCTLLPAAPATLGPALGLTGPRVPAPHICTLDLPGTLWCKPQPCQPLPRLTLPALWFNVQAPEWGFTLVADQEGC